MRHKLNEQCEQVKVVPFLYRCIGAANYNEPATMQLFPEIAIKTKRALRHG